jgi:hypothetical protein
MSIRLDLSPEEEALLRERAASQGVPLEDLATELLRKQLHPAARAGGAHEPLLPVVDGQGVFHEERWQAVQSRLSQLFAASPTLPTEALTREALYQDHD